MTQFTAEQSKTLIDELLEEQRLLTAVTRFAQKDEGGEIASQEGQYRDLIPLSRPAAGEQYAFEVDLDRCSGCKACVVACHNLNGLEPGESWRSVGLLVTEEAESPMQQTVTTACHHCVDPACLNGCPVLAYEKDPVTGIVRHLDDQCIGCQYCVLKCPYEVPRYSSRLGIVRKCDMCHGRLRAGEAPACVQSCPSEAIRITIVGQAVVASEYLNPKKGGGFLPASPDPKYTIPTTRYISAKELSSELRAADELQVAPAPPHWPLVLMLVFTQAGIGGIWSELAARLSGAEGNTGQVLVSNATILTGLFASILHLGRPLHAWRAFIGVRRSWLSREIIAFGVLATNGLLLLALEALPISVGGRLMMLSASAALGAAALLCSVMVYVDTPREFWGWRQTAPRFIGTTMLLGLSLSAVFHTGSPFIVVGISLVGGFKLAHELALLRHLSAGAATPLYRTAVLLTRDLLPVTLARFGLLALGIVLAQFCFTAGHLAPVAVPVIMFLTLFASEIAERYLFFRAVSQPKMPGGVA